MVSKCANPACEAHFRYLREGKLFRFEVDHMLPDRANLPGPRLVTDKKSPKSVEHFWLCGECSARMTLIADRGGVAIVPLTQQYFRRAVAS